MNPDPKDEVGCDDDCPCDETVAPGSDCCDDDCPCDEQQE